MACTIGLEKMKVSWVKLDDLPERCRSAFEKAELVNPEWGLDWFRNLAEHALNPGMQVYVLDANSDGYESVSLPVMYERQGGVLRALANFYTSLYAPAIVGQGVQTCVRTICRKVKEEGWTCMRLAPLDRDGFVFRLFLDALQESGWRVFPYFCFTNWYLKVDGRTYETYFKDVPSRLRNTITRRERKLLAGGRGRIEIFLGGDGIEDVIAAWTRIYNASWKVPEPYPEFMPSLIRLSADKGWLRLGLVYYDGEPVAAQVWLVNQSRAAIYKLAYDERFAELSAGTVLTARLMRHVMDTDRVAEVDYLIGDDAYKRDWMSHQRERWGIVAYNPRTLTGFLFASREAAARIVKRLLAMIRK